MLMRRDTFGDLFRQINRLQNDMTFMFGRPGPATAYGLVPPVNVWEDEQNVYAEAELPGVDPEKIDVSVIDGNRLVLQAERKPVEIQQGVQHRRERSSSDFSRELTLPTMLDTARVSATYKNGVL